MSRGTTALGLMTFLQASWALVHVGLPLLVLAGVLLAVPASRRRSGLRWLAYLLLATDAATFAVMLEALVPVFVHGVELDRARRSYEARTLALAAPQDVAGVSFPAGSTVHLREDGSIEYGTVPIPTPISGLMLVEQFSVDGQGVAGTLAGPAEVEGIPCWAGRVWWDRNVQLHCTLARDHAFAGHLLAAGRPVGFVILATGVRQLQAGTLARPELLFGASWPAGTILAGTSAPPERLAHGPAPDGEQIRLCLMPGETVLVQGATLHGTLTFGAQEAARWLSRGCEPFADDYPHDGYALVGVDRYLLGTAGGRGIPLALEQRRRLRADPVTVAPWLQREATACA